MTPEEINSALAQVVPSGQEVDTCQIVMVGPFLVEVKARTTVDQKWYQGFVRIRPDSYYGEEAS